MRVEELVDLATDVPAEGQEAHDWRARGYAELLEYAHLAGTPGIVAAVDRAAAALPPVTRHFAARLLRLRRRVGPLPPPRYPEPLAVPYAPPAPAPPVQAAAGRLALLADAWRDTLTVQRHDPAIPGSAEATVVDARSAEAVLAATRQLRWLGRQHRCVQVPELAGLTWRNWMLRDGRPLLAVAPILLSADQVTVWFGLHVGTHLDHLTALVDEGGGDHAARLQFGRGVLIAESVAMVAEFTIPRLVTEGRCRPALLRVWHAGIVERLARLPRLSEWGPAAAPGSVTMALAAEASNPEFATVPTYAAAYTAGPFQLAEAEFEDPLIPAPLRSALRQWWKLTTTVQG